MFLILSSCIQLNNADNMLSMKLYSLVDKTTMTSQKFSLNMPKSIKAYLDLNKARKGSYLLQETMPNLPANLENTNRDGSYVVNGIAQDAKKDNQQENESKTFQKPLLSKLISMVLLIITFLSLKVISKLHLKKIEPMIFALTLFCLLNPVYLVGPLFWTSSMSYGNGGAHTVNWAINGVKNQGYCNLALVQNPDTTYVFQIQKYNADGTLASSVTRGAFPQTKCGMYSLALFYTDGKCKGFFSDATGAAYNFLKFYDGVSTDTDVQYEMSANIALYKGLMFNDGSAVACGYYGSTAYILKVNSAYTLTTIATSTGYFFNMMKFDENTIYVFGQSGGFVMRRYDAALALQGTITATVDNSWEVNDSTLSTDGKILIVGHATPVSGGGIAKMETTGVQIWITGFLSPAIPMVFQLIVMSDGTIMASGSCIVGSSGPYVPYLAKVGNDGTKIWQVSYTLPVNALIYGIAALDDYSVTLVGTYYYNNPSTCAYTLKATLACQPGYIVNAAANGCMIGNLFIPIYFV